MPWIVRLALIAAVLALSAGIVYVGVRGFGVVVGGVGSTLSGFVKEVVSENVSLIATDENPGYTRLHQKDGFPHETVQHTNDEYVRGVVHTQNLDSFWSLLKRGIMGSYHKVSRGYLPLYLNEFSFRHNHRNDPDIFDAVLAGC